MSYGDRKVLYLEYMVGEWVFVEGFTHEGCDEVRKHIAKVAYELALAPGLSGVQLVFHILMLKKYHSDGAHVIQWVLILLDLNFTFEEEPLAILDRPVRKLRSKEIV
ncbi:uncharacterized protein LOC132607784 [Lycium barbarum]|uniref:uncharacterized protein LOC132607784 n=1 Tax=Lycium barbarum TaxID=112863 RepID=UPI00293E170D|nr:uncharacterized protein LOC132607784 [Lycium barbarum]